MPTDFDHTSFAVTDALAWARRVRRDLGAVPVAGELQPEFRWVQLRVADGGSGATIEFLEPNGEGFLSRYLARHGEGPHHVTFMVDDLRLVVERVRELGFAVTGEAYEDPEWQEAFVAPDEVHGTVIQLAATDGTDSGRPDWCAAILQTPVRGRGRLGPTYLRSTDLRRTEQLFVEALDATVTQATDGLQLAWPGGTVVVARAEIAGITGMALDSDDGTAIRIGPAVLGGAALGVRDRS